LFSTADVIAWSIQREKKAKQGDRIDLEEAKRRKLVAEAELAELEAAVKRDELVPIDVVADAVGAEYAAVRAKLLSIPTKLAPILAITSDVEEVRSLLIEKLREALEELRDADIPAGDALPPARKAEAGALV
jgi:hypothetical protein